jgi:bacillithiol synthase
LRSAVMARSNMLSEAGYHEQVKVDENFTGFFAYRGRAREVVKPNELTKDIAWSPNVLLRPILQDAILPTAAYIGGPAEVAYFAQAAAVYETLRMPMPPIYPRISATILEPRVARTLEKYDISFMDVFRGREFLKRKAVEAVQDGELFERLRRTLEQEMESLRSALNAVDPTLIGALDTSCHKMLHQVETLRTKYVNAVTKRNEMVERHLETILNSLFPEKKLQERLINITSYLVRYGDGFVSRLERELSLDSTQHQLVEI